MTLPSDPMTIASRLHTIRTAISTTATACGRAPSTITLVAVSKRHPAKAIEEAMAANQVLFGESYIQEAEEKWRAVQGAEFHFIGHIQSNKAKTAAELFSLVQTVDRFKLAKALNKHLEKLDRTLQILIQVNIGRDPSKSGVAPEDTADLLRQIQNCNRLLPTGLMTIPPRTEDQEETRLHFRNLRLLSCKLAAENLFSDNTQVELSMGMSHDFKTAIEEGATIIRVGTAIFGERPERI